MLSADHQARSFPKNKKQNTFNTPKALKLTNVFKVFHLPKGSYLKLLMEIQFQK